MITTNSLKKYFDLLQNNSNLWNIKSIQKPIDNLLLDASNFPNNIIEYNWISKDKFRWNHEINSIMKLSNGNYVYFYSGETHGGFADAIKYSKLSSDNVLDKDNFFSTTMELYVGNSLESVVNIIKNNIYQPFLYKFYLYDIQNK